MYTYNTYMEEKNGMIFAKRILNRLNSIERSGGDAKDD